MRPHSSFPISNLNCCILRRESLGGSEQNELVAHTKTKLAQQFCSSNSNKQWWAGRPKNKTRKLKGMVCSAEIEGCSTIGELGKMAEKNGHFWDHYCYCWPVEITLQQALNERIGESNTLPVSIVSPDRVLKQKQQQKWSSPFEEQDWAGAGVNDTAHSHNGVGQTKTKKKKKKRTVH